MTQFLAGALCMASAVAGLYFWRSWRDTRDRLFVYFALAFWVFALHWATLGMTTTAIEDQYRVYISRLLAFLLIIAGIVDKNRTERRRR